MSGAVIGAVDVTDDDTMNTAACHRMCMAIRHHFQRTESGSVIFVDSTGRELTNHERVIFGDVTVVLLKQNTVKPLAGTNRNNVYRFG